MLRIRARIGHDACGKCGLGRRERNTPHRQFVDRTAAESCVARARTNFHRGARDAAVEAVAQHRRLRIDAVHKEPQARGERGSVVGCDDVRPRADRQLRLHLNARGAAGPEVDHAPTQLSVGDEQLEPRAIGVVGVEARRVQHRRARVALAWLDPERDAHRIVAREAREARERHATVAVEMQGFPELSVVCERDLAELLGTRAVGGRGLRRVDRIRRFSIRELVERVTRRGCGQQRWRRRVDEPVVHRALHRGCACAHHRSHRLLAVRAQRSFLLGLLVVRKPHERRRRAKRVRVALEPVLVDRAEHRGEPVKLARRNGVVLVIVAARALNREPEERGAEGRHAVGDSLLAEFLGNRAAFLGHAVQAVERARDLVRLPLSA